MATSSVTVESTAAADWRRRKKKSLSLVFRQGYSPATIGWALVTIRLSAAWRKTCFSSTVGMQPESIRSRSTFPGPTLGSWSESPTRISLQPIRQPRRRDSKRVVSTIDISSMTTASAFKGCCSLWTKVVTSEEPKSTSNSRWMVFASRPVTSLTRLAARPVGAAMAIRRKLRRDFSRRPGDCRQDQGSGAAALSAPDSY